MIGTLRPTFLCLLLALLVACGVPDRPPQQGAQAGVGRAVQEPPAALAATPTRATATAQPVASPSAALAGCGALFSGVADRFETIEELAWSSHQIVAGTIVERLPSVRSTAPISPRAPDQRAILTDYVVRVDQRVRGLPVPTVRVRQVGGTVDGCSLTNMDAVDLPIGGRFLLFLRIDPEVAAQVPTYRIIADYQGAWPLDPNGTVTTRAPHHQRYNGVPLAQLAGQMRTILAGPPPRTAFLERYLVPLDQAPLPPLP